MAPPPGRLNGRSHELVFRAPGRRDLRRVVQATRDQSLILAMEPAEHETPPPAERPSHRHRDSDSHGGDKPAKGRGASGSAAAAAGGTAAAVKRPATPTADPTLPTPPTPPKSRRLPAVITDID